MKKAIALLSKLVECEEMIFTGSFVLKQFGLVDNAKDLDVLIVNPSSNTISTLNRLRIPQKGDDRERYLSTTFFKIKIEETEVDIFVRDNIYDTLEIEYEGLKIKVSKVPGIISAKKSYNRLKDIIQLKHISEKFFRPGDLEKFIENEQKNYL